MQNKKPSMTTKLIVYCGLFAALAAVLGQLLAFRPTESMKFTLDKFVLFLSGMFFGPLAGGLTGLVAEFVGGNLLGRGFTPWLCLPAVLYGVSGGLFRQILKNRFTLPRLALAYAIPTVFGAVLIQSAALAWTYSPATFLSAFYANLFFRAIQFAIMFVLEVAIIYSLVRSNIFAHMNLWPKLTKEERRNSYDSN